MTSEEIKTEIFRSLGAASMCWEYVGMAGVFDSTQAEKIGNELWDKIEQYKAQLCKEQRELCAKKARLDYAAHGHVGDILDAILNAPEP